MTPLESQLGLYYEFGSFRLDPGERRLYREGEIVLLPPKEFDLLLLLVRSSGKLKDRESLIKALWPKTVVEEANLNVHISGLRKTLGENPEEYRYIETVPRLGYRFIAPVIEVKSPEQTEAETLPFSHHPSESMLQPVPWLGEKNGSSLADPVQSKRGYMRYRTAAVTLPLWLLALAALGILVIMLLKPYRSGTTEVTESAAFNVVPLTTYPGHEYHPAFSPDGDRIAFVWTGDKGDNADIYVRLVDGGNSVRLTTDPGDDVNPVWSPDGSMIAFYRSTAAGDGIYIMPSLGGPERKLTTTWANRFSFGSHTWLHWSPDGKWLVLSDKSSAAEPFSLFLVSPETGERRRLTSPQPTYIGDCSPAFSPDGSQVAFVRVFSAVVGEVYLVPTEGGEPRRLTHEGGGASNLTWTLNGREIVFSMRYGGRTQLHRVSIDGGPTQWLAASGNDAHFPSFSPQGNRLAWTKNTANADIFRAALTNNQKTNNHDANKSFAGVIVSTTFEASPQYSPDGKRIAFQSSRSGDGEIWVCDSEGENPVKLTSFRGPLTGSPNWSPDGRQVVFDSRPEGNADIYLVSSDGGGQPRRLTTDPGEDIVPSYSRDGRFIYFTSSRSGRLQVWKMATDGSGEVQVTKEGGFEPRESPDGRWLYYAKERGSSAIWRIPASGGDEAFVYDFQQKNFTRMWAVANEGIYFAFTDNSARTTIKFYRFSNSSLKTVIDNITGGSLPNGISGLSLSPNGRWMLFPLIVQRGSDLMMIENYH
ncbi:MAG: PD40 domain-containing protein [Blastocatellia bacterium]|nr:PD40 domain-containing protein [Blastocatellia bacterium]